MNYNQETNDYLDKLSILIKNPFGEEQVTIKGFSNINDFIKKEQSIWKSLESDDQAIKHWTNKISEFIVILVRISVFAESNRSEFEGQFNRLKKEFIELQKYTHSFPYVSTKSIIGNLIIDEIKKGETDIYGIFRYFKNEFPTSNSRNLIGWLHAYEFDHQDPDKFIKRRQVERKTLNQIRNEWEQKTQDLNTDYNQLKTDYVDWKKEYETNHQEWNNIEKQKFEDLFNASEKKIKENEALYTKKLELSGPVRYWKKRAEIYRKRGHSWLVWLSVISSFLILLMISILYNLPEVFNKSLFKGDPQAIKGFILLATVISIGAYLIRILARLTFSSYHIERDAEERRQLTMVYLALSKSGNVTDKERNLILQSLFSRVETGLLKNDSTPTMPGLGAVINKINGGT